MKKEPAREQLNDYFAAELEGLRTSVIDFAEENPRIAEELSLNRHNEGKSQDPHIEMLIQSFAWMTSRLRQNIESESGKLPAILLQQLYPQLISSIPSMAIAECHVNGFAANFDSGYLLHGRQLMEPIKIKGNPEQVAKLSVCRMSTCHDTVLWPLKVTQVNKLAINDEDETGQHSNKALSAIQIKIDETDEGAAKDIFLNNPLRFYINLNEHSKFKFYDFISRHFIGATLLNDKGETVATLTKKDLRMCGFEDNQRLFPACHYQDLGFSLLQDYFSFPEKFMFFEMTGLDNIQPQSGFSIKLVFNENMSRNIELNNDSLKLNCVPIINLFEKTSEPIPLHHKDYRYRLYPSREHYQSHEIIRVNKIFSVNKHGEHHEILPYFSLNSRRQAHKEFRFLVQQENSHKKTLAGTETWLSIYDQEYANVCPIGETIYAETLCCNRASSELFPRSQQFSLIGSSPVVDMKLLTRPTRHRSCQLHSKHLWQLLSHFSLYYVSLTDENLATDNLTRFLSLYANNDDPISQRQIDSIEKLESEDDVQPDLQDGWRGYYHGTKFTLTLTERKFDGSSSILFGRVLYQFLALFCHINSFVRLEVKLGSRSVHQWEPMSGHKVLV